MKKILVNLKDWLNLEDNHIFAEKLDGLDITLFPGMPYLSIYKDKNLTLGAQDVSSFDSGPHTGSVSIDHLKEFNVTCVLLNHNEQRIENDDVLKDKVRRAIIANVEVLICINSIDENELKKLDVIFEDIKNPKLISIAYEPNTDLSLQEIKESLNVIKGRFEKRKFNKLIYGGNISKSNIELYNKELSIDGFLISRHALDIEELKTIIEIAQ